jgi:predicted transcriptional regulator
MNTKKPFANKTAQAGNYVAVSDLKELEEMLDCEIRKSLIEADAGDFATDAEVKSVIAKWKNFRK